MTEKIDVLGAYGSREEGHASTCFRLSKHVLIDGGNILALKDEAIHIEHIFLSHAHLDHIVDIPFFLDGVFSERRETLCVYGSRDTIHAIKEHIFNDIIWPDFSRFLLPKSGKDAIRFIEIPTWQEYCIGDISIRGFLTAHCEGSMGYIVKKNHAETIITCDTSGGGDVMNAITQCQNLKNVVLECSFPNTLKKVSIASKHFCPETLEAFLQPLQKDFNLYVNHLKPFYESHIRRELAEGLKTTHAHILRDGDSIEW